MMLAILQGIARLEDSKSGLETGFLQVKALIIQRQRYRYKVYDKLAKNTGEQGSIYTQGRQDTGVAH